ncbi:MAG: hypothetical protein AB1609_15665 [Bacillota bacterium]
MDLGASFAAATGVELQLFTTVAFALAAGAYREGRLHINPTAWLSRTRVEPGTLARVLSLLGSTEEELRRSFGSFDAGRFNPYELTPLRKTPLLRLHDGTVLVLSPRLLLERATEGVFWDLSDYWKAHGERFRAFWGALVEEYAWQLFAQGQRNNRGLFRSFRYQVPRRGQCDTSDLMLVHEDLLVLVEVNSGRLRLHTKETGDVQRFEEDLERYLLNGGVGQLYRVFQDYQAAYFQLSSFEPRRAIPVVVTFESFPWNLLTAQRIRKLASEKGHCSQEFANSWTIIDLEELEMLTALQEAGHPVGRVIGDWQSSPMWFQPLKNYLIARERYAPHSCKISGPAYVTQGYELMGTRMAELLFGGADQG